MAEEANNVIHVDFSERRRGYRRITCGHCGNNNLFDVPGVFVICPCREEAWGEDF